MEYKHELIIIHYMKEVEHYFPYSKERRKEALKQIRAEVEDAVEDSKNPLVETMGYPEELARNFSQNYKWDIQKASILERLGAFVLDTLITGILGLFCLIILSVYWFNFIYGDASYLGGIAAARGGYSLLDLDVLFIEIPLFFLILACYTITFGHTLVCESKTSRTIGKKVLNLIVIDTTGVRINTTQAFIRNISKLIPVLLIFDMILNKVNQRHSDRLNNTQVIYEKENGRNTRMIRFIALFLILVIVLLVMVTCTEFIIRELVFKKNTLSN